MNKFIFSLLIVFSNLVLFSQNSINENHFAINSLDTIKGGRFEIVLLNDYTWQYVNHDSVVAVLNYEDSVRTNDYILRTKLCIPDSLTLFTENWYTLRLLAYSDDENELMYDTIVLRLTTDNNKFIIPNPGKLNSRFGWRNGRMHQGVDINLHIGDTVVAAFDGVVRCASHYNGYGNLVIIRHNNGLETYYAHLSAVKCEKNSYVKAGDIIGLGGNTGWATGPHLHFEVRYKDNPIDPEMVIDFESGDIISNLLYLMPEKFGYIKEYKDAEYYTVCSGDSLYSISSKYRTSIRQLCALNDISENTVLSIGRTLRVR